MKPFLDKFFLHNFIAGRTINHLTVFQCGNNLRFYLFSCDSYARQDIHFEDMKGHRLAFCQYVFVKIEIFLFFDFFCEHQHFFEFFHKYLRIGNDFSKPDFGIDNELTQEILQLCLDIDLLFFTKILDRHRDGHILFNFLYY